MFVVTAIAIIAVILNQPQNSEKSKKLKSYDPEVVRSMTYEQVKKGDEDISGTDYVKFDAFFLRDLDGDGIAEKVRGSCRKIGETDTLYMELNVLTNGHLENGTITINGTNMSLRTTIPKDNEIKENAIGNDVREIKFNTLTNGTQKLLSGAITSEIRNNINDYSKVNSVTIKGTHVSDDGIEIPIEKTVNFNVDWHGTISIQCIDNYQYQILSKSINEEEGTFTIGGNITLRDVTRELIGKRSHIEAKIPNLNGYAPQKVELIGDNGTYNENTQILIGDSETEVDENGKVIKRASSSYQIKITYSLDAYKTLGGDTVELRIPITAYFEGFNNPNEEFKNPYKSNVVNSTFVFTARNPVGTVARFDIEVGKYIFDIKYGTRNIISKEKALNVYNGVSESDDDDTYIVKWYGLTGSDGDASGMIMKEDPEEITDKFIKTDSTTISMENYTTNVGIYFSDPNKLLGENGWIKVYDDETNELLETFDKENWNKYSSWNPYRYERDVNHIRIETSKTNASESINVYNVKKLNDEKIVSSFTREEFDNLQHIKSTLIGYLGGKVIDKTTHSAKYEAPYSDFRIYKNIGTLTTQETQKNMLITISALGDEYKNQIKWVNGVFVVQIPEDIIDLKIKNVTIDNSKVKIVSYEQFENDGKTYIKINTENDEPETFDIEILCEMTPNPQTITKTDYFKLYAYNGNSGDYWDKVQDTLDINDNLNTTEMIGSTSTTISLVSPNSLLTSQMITNYDDEGSITIAPQIVEIGKDTGTADINVAVTNNYSSTISGVKILGRIPFEGNKYVINNNELGSEFSTQMTSKGITVPLELQDKVMVYYSEKENATNDLSNKDNGWTTTPNFSKVKSYLIDLGEYVLNNKGNTYTFIYTISIPKNVQYNQVAYGHHAVYFSLDTEEGKFKTQTEPNKVGITIVKEYNLQLSKYQKGKEKKVAGATYSITEVDTGNTKTKVTNEKGTLTFEKLYVDRTYIIKEIKTPEDYELNEEEIKFVTSEENGQLVLNLISGTTRRAEAIQVQDNQEYKIEIDVEDEVKPKLKVIKSEKGNDTKVGFAKFRLTEQNSEKRRVLITNNAGEIDLNGLTIGREYTLEEIGVEGYYQLSLPIKFTIVNDNGEYIANVKDEQGAVRTTEITEIDSIPTVNLTIENEKIPRYTLKINKVARGEDMPLEGAIFRLFKGNKKLGDYTTGQDGSTIIQDLYQYEDTIGIDQTYTLKEIEAPTGYLGIKDITFRVKKNAEGLLVMDVQEGKIKDQVTSENNEVITITIEDSKSFKLVKTDGETQELLPNTKFAIYNVDNGTVEIARDSKNNILGTKENIDGKDYYVVTTNSKGEIEADLREGLYKVIEVQASDDKYDITNNVYYFGIGTSRETETVFIPQWSDSLEGSVFCQTTSVAEMADGGYVTGGWFKETIQMGENLYTGEYYAIAIIVKYSSTGEIEWTNTFGSDITGAGTYGKCKITSLAGTEDGGCIAGGYRAKELPYETFYEPFLIKYDKTGQADKFSSFTMLNSNNKAGITSVAVTPSGEYIVGGFFDGTIQINGKSYTSKGEQDGILIRYNSELEPQDVTTFGGSNCDKVTSIAITEAERVIVAGIIGRTSDAIELEEPDVPLPPDPPEPEPEPDPDPYPDPDPEPYLYSDSDPKQSIEYNKIIQIGEDIYTSIGPYDSVLIEYNKEFKANKVDIIGGGESAYIGSIATTKDGGCIAAGSFSKTVQVGKEKYTAENSMWGSGILIKYSNTLEVEAVSIPDESFDSSFSTVAVTKDGEYIVGGNFNRLLKIGKYEYFSQGYRDAILMKYNNALEVNGVSLFSGTNGENYIKSIIASKNGDIIVSGDFINSIEIGEDSYLVEDNYDNGFIMKCNETQVANLMVTSAMSIGAVGSYNYIDSVAATKDGGYVVAGCFEGNVQIGDKEYINSGYSADGVIIKYNKASEIEWSNVIVCNGERGLITSIVTTADEEIIVCGLFNGEIQIGDQIYTTSEYYETGYATGYLDAFLVKYSRGGEIKDVAIFGGSDDDVVITSAVVTQDEKIIACGKEGNTNGILLEYNREFELEKMMQIDNINIDSIENTKDGEIIAAGSYRGTIQIGDETFTSSSISGNAIIIKYSNQFEIDSVVTFECEDDSYFDITSIAIAEDGDILVGGELGGTIQIGDNLYTSDAAGELIIINYDSKLKPNRVSRFVPAYGDATINSIVATKDGGYLAAVNFLLEIKIGNKEYHSNGVYNTILIKSNEQGYVENAKIVGGDGHNDQINSLEIIEDEGIIAVGSFESDTIEIDGKTLTRKGYRNGIILKLVSYAGVAEKEILSVENYRKEFKITTDVKEINGIKGGSILGEDKNPYEVVKYGENNTEAITMEPDENYEIINITVNGKEHPFIADPDGTYTMPTFENITEDKHIVVTYSLKDNKITINKINSKTQEPIAGVKFKLDQIEESENAIGELTDNSDIYTEVKTKSEVTNVLGNLTASGTSGYHFIENEEGYISNNQGVDDTTANSYFKIDLSEKEGTYAVKLNASVSSELGTDYGYAIITQDSATPEIPRGAFIDISGNESGEYTSEILNGGNTYYLHLGYYKNSSKSGGKDQFVVKNIKVYEAEECSVEYNFIKESGKYKSTNQGQKDTVSNSYIPIDLSGYAENYILTVNAQISSESYGDFGYVTVTNDETRPRSNNSTGRFIYISGNKRAKDYTTTLSGGSKYYLHFGYSKNSSTNYGSDTFTINSVKIEPEGNPLYHTEVTTNSVGQAITQIPFGKYRVTEVTAPDGYQGLDKSIEIDFSSDTDKRVIIKNENRAQATVRAGEFVVENIPKAKVTVHHYLKNKNGEYTTEKVAEDEIIYGNYEEWYHTKPYLDLEKYDLEKNGNEQYVMPEKAADIFKENNDDVIYYYEERQCQVTVHHYIEGTSDSVPLVSGNLAADVVKMGYEEDAYETEAISNEQLSNEYELVEVPTNASGIYERKETIITYYYKKIQRKVSIIKHEKESDKLLEGAKFTITKVEQSKEITEEPVVYVTNVNGKINVDLEVGEYKITEIEAPEGYQLPENPVTKVTITRETTEENLEITNERIKGKVIVHHYVKGIDIPVLVIDEESGDVVEAEDEIKEGYYGEPYATKPKENLAPGYTYDSVNTEETSGTYTESVREIIYYYNAVIDIDVVKRWNHTNNIYEKPESITIQLYADGELTDKELTLTVNDKIEIDGESETEETWRGTFEQLPKYNVQGKEIVYTIEEKESEESKTNNP